MHEHCQLLCTFQVRLYRQISPLADTEQKEQLVTRRFDSYFAYKCRDSSVAEHSSHTRIVGGSNPSLGTNNGSVVQWFRISALQAEDSMVQIHLGPQRLSDFEDACRYVRFGADHPTQVRVLLIVQAPLVESTVEVRVLFQDIVLDGEMEDAGVRKLLVVATINNYNYNLVAQCNWLACQPVTLKGAERPLRVQVPSSPL